MTDKTAIPVTDGMGFRTVILERLRYNVLMPIKISLLSGASLDLIERAILGDAIATIKADIYSEKVGVVTVSHPRDWWQAVKERFAPAWFTRRWPVIYKTHVIDCRVVYPMFNPALPNQPWQWSANQSEEEK